MIASIRNKFIVATLLIVLWYVAASFYDPLIFPSPLEVARAGMNIGKSGEFAVSILATLLNTIIGICFALLSGIVLGLLSGFSKSIYTIFHPLVIIVQSTPVISWILLALIWFSNDIIPVVLVIFSSAPIVIVNISEGVRNVDKKLLEMAHIYRIKRSRILRDIYLPSILSQLLSSIKLILGLSFKVAVMAEVVGRVRGGIGEKLNWAWINIETADIMAWTIIIVIVTYLVEKLVMKIIVKKEKIVE